MKTLHKTIEMVEMELDDINRKDRPSMTDLEAVYKMVDILKDIETIIAMRDGYSDRGSYLGGRMDRRNDYSMEGRYPKRNRYSRDDSREKMIGSLEEALEEATTENERQAIKHLMEKLSC